MLIVFDTAPLRLYVACAVTTLSLHASSGSEKFPKIQVLELDLLETYFSAEVKSGPVVSGL